MIEWPSEERIDIIGTNGNTGEHYMNQFDLIRQWAQDRNILQGSTSSKQIEKLGEEFGELARGLAEKDDDSIKDAIGDMVVVLTVMAHQEMTSIEACIDKAWNEIKHRKGKMVDGIFVKEIE